MRLSRLFSAALPLVTVALLGASGTDQDIDDPEISQFVREAIRYVDQLKVHLADDESVVERVKKPVLVYKDPSPSTTIGGLWVWGRPGRPKAFAEVIQFNGAQFPLIVALSHSAADLITLNTPDNRSWTPQEVQIEPQLIADAPAPSEKEDERRDQMTDLALRLKSFELWEPNNTRYDLTILQKPVLRYREEAIQVQDGSAFVIANVRNPEVIVLVEAIGTSLESSRWHYSFARMGSAELHVELDGQEIWHTNRAKNSTGEPGGYYWLYSAKR